MPCYDDRSDLDNAENRKAAAILCAIMRLCEAQDSVESLIAALDLGQAGVTADDVRIWWHNHKMRDAQAYRHG